MGRITGMDLKGRGWDWLDCTGLPGGPQASRHSWTPAGSLGSELAGGPGGGSGYRRRPCPSRQERAEAGEIQGFAVEVTLQLIAAMLLQELALGRRFHPFRHGAH